MFNIDKYFCFAFAAHAAQMMLFGVSDIRFEGSFSFSFDRVTVSNFSFR